jgi:tetratricopeptide (TPR) repeat protein
LQKFLFAGAALLALMLTAAVPDSRAVDLEEGNQQLKEAKILYDNLQYDEALTKLKAALKQKNLRKSEVVDIYRYMGSIYIIKGQKENATRAFELLIKVEPNYEMNPLLTSPKILDFFNKVKEQVRSREQVTLKHTPLQEVPAGERIELKAYVVDSQNRLDKLLVYFRKRGDPEFSSVDMAIEGGAAGGAKTFIGFIPFLWSLTDEVELFVDYYLAGVDKNGRWVANMGNPKQPLTFRINLLEGKLPEGVRRTPLLKAWWFWTLVGVGAAGLATGIYFGVAGGGGGAPQTGQAILIVR